MSGARNLRAKRLNVHGLLLVLLGGLFVAACAGPNVSPTLTATQVQTVSPLTIFPRPPKVISPKTPEPVTLTPQITKKLNALIDAGEMGVYAYLCFATQDRLTYQTWVDELVAATHRYRILIEQYEDMIRKYNDRD